MLNKIGGYLVFSFFHYKVIIIGDGLLSFSLYSAKHTSTGVSDTHNELLLPLFPVFRIIIVLVEINLERIISELP